MRYIRRRRQGFEFQFRIPGDVASHFGGKTMLSRGLDTRDANVAQARADELAAHYRTMFEALRGNPAAHVDLRRKLRQHAHEQAREGQWDSESIAIGMDIIVDEAQARRVPLDDQGNPSLLPADLQGRLDGLADYRHELDGLPLPVRPEYGMTVSEAGAEYLAKRPDDIREGTREQFETTYRMFSSFVADKPWVTVTRKDAVRFLDEMREFAPAWGRSPKTKKRSFAELKALYHDKGKKLATKTLTRYANHLAVLWEWTKTRGETTGESPFTKIISGKGVRRRRNGWLPLEVEELNALFKALPESAWLWEIAAVALFSGMRANEICSLTWDNVKLAEGIWYFDIIAAKSDAGVRPVPVHSRLSWLLERRPNDTSQRIWPMLKQGGTDKKYSHYYSKRFTVWRKKAGVTLPGKKFHSLRKNVVRCFERGRVPQNEAAEIIGHEKFGITYRVYNPDGLTMMQRQALVELIDYPGLVLPWEVEANPASVVE